MREAIIKRNIIITVISLVIFFFVSLFITSYANHKDLEDDLVNISNILGQQLLETVTEEDMQDVVKVYTNNQDWLRVIITNSLGNVIIDSTSDNVNYQITNREVEIANSNSSDQKRIYMDDNGESIYYIMKINEDIIVRTSLPLQSNTNYILNSTFYMLILIIGVLIFGIIYSQKTSDIIVDTFSSISRHLKTINDGNYQKINTNHKFIEVQESLEEINEINENISKNIFKIKKESDKIAFIINNMQQGIIIVDQFENLLIINEYALKALNLDDIQGDNLLLSNVITNKNILTSIQESITNEHNKCFDFYDEHKELIYSFTITYLQNKWHMDEENIGVVVIFIIDVTEERKNDEIKAEFIANASHELKTPITSISGFSELILNGFGECDQKTKKYIEKIFRESNRMKSTIDELLFLSNLEYKGNQISLSEVVFLPALIKETVNYYQDFALKNRVFITTNIDDLSIIGSNSLIRHLINNLIENAIKYNKEDGTVLVKLKEEKNQIIFQVSDTGIGIEEKYLSKIFDRFFCIASSRNRLTSGTGLGLTISKKICQVHDATINIVSEVDKGSTFSIIFKKPRKNQLFSQNN